MKLSPKNWVLLPVFILSCYAVAYFGSQFSPGEWYQSLNRAPWNPPNIAFPIVWSVLYLFIAIAGWLIFISGTAKLKALWLVQLILNCAWSWIFFGQQWVAFGLVELLLIVITVGLLIISCWQQQLKITSLLLAPYLAWLCIATSLNAYILFAN